MTQAIRTISWLCGASLLFSPLLATAVTIERQPLSLIGYADKTAKAGQISKRNDVRRYLIELQDPSAMEFQRVEQLSSAAKALALQPTAPDDGAQFRADLPAVKVYRQYLKAAQDQALTAFSTELGRKLEAPLRWDLIGNGFALTLSGAEVAVLQRHPLIKSIREEVMYQPATDTSVTDIGANYVWEGHPLSIPQQIRGEGVVVGIIDSGINFAHPAFADVAPDGYNHTNPRGVRYGLCANGTDPRCNDKLIGIYDFINESGAQGANAGLDLTGHGTHVAATAVGNRVTGTVNVQITSFASNINGVAPRANLIVYKVCQQAEPVGCPGAATTAAVNQAIADGVNLVNFSIGGNAFSPWEDPRAFLDLRVAGALASISAGNAGPMPQTVKSPSNAPWVVSVANVTSRKSYGTVLANINGTGIAAPFSLAGEGMSGGVAEAPVVYAGDFGDGSCVGSFPGGTFTGRIVVCDQGKSDALFQKAQRIGAAGAIGLVVANRQLDGENNVATPITLLPTVHLGYSNGQTLKRAIATARTGGGQIRARIDGLNVTSGGLAGVLNDSSSKGPVAPFSGYLKPNIAAPGTNIVSAYVPNATSFAALTGTSMAAPHVAGVMALLKAGHPTWTADQIESAILTSADNSLLIETGNEAARYFEGGAGMVIAPLAMKAGLHFKTTKAEFLAANPQQGGIPESLNMPYMHSAGCVTVCTFMRTVTANVGGTWNVVSDARTFGMNIVTEPSTFSLAAGQSATLMTTVSFRDATQYGKWFEGNLVLSSTTDPGNISSQFVPVSVFASGGVNPFAISVNNAAASGSATVDIAIQAGLPEVITTATALKAITPANPVIPVDATNDEVFDNVNQNFFRLVPAPSLQPESSDGVLYADVRAAATQDMELFMGFDLDEDERPDENEILCVSSQAPGAIEACLIETHAYSATRQLNYWVMVQNFASGPDNPAPEINVYNSTYWEVDQNFGMTAQGMLGKTIAGQSLPVQLSWFMPQVAPGAKAISVLRIGADRTRPGNVVNLPVILTRSAATDLPPIVLNARNDSKAIALPPGQAHERIVVDVPPNQTALILRAAGVGGNVDLYVSKASAAPTPPTFAAAPPRNQQPFSSIGTSNTEIVALEGGQLSPGRYYVTPVNVGTSLSQVTLTVTGEFNANTQRAPSNGYFNPGRSGHGLFLATLPNLWAMAWYTFDAAGNPVWYTAQSAFLDNTDSVWSARLFRSTWNGSRDLPQPVGKVMLTQTGPGQFVYSWQLDGAYGSEPFQPIGAPQCANGNFSVGGGWLRPDQSGWGSYFLNFAGNFEAEAIYVYDDKGLPRWFIGDGTYAPTLQKTFFQVSGFCPTCALVPTTRVAVGAASRTLNSTTQGTFTSSLSFAGGVSGNWVQTNVSWSKLTPDLSCQ